MRNSNSVMSAVIAIVVFSTNFSLPNIYIYSPAKGRGDFVVAHARGVSEVFYFLSLLAAAMKLLFAFFPVLTTTLAPPRLWRWQRENVTTLT